MKQIIFLTLSCFLLPALLCGQKKQSDYLEKQITECNLEVRKLDNQLSALQIHKQRIMQEYMDGEYCSECDDTKTELENDGDNESFEEHLARVKGKAMRPSQAEINKKAAEFNGEFTRLGQQRADQISACNKLRSSYTEALWQERAERDKARQDSLAQVKAEKERRDQEIKDSLEQAQLEKQRRAQAYLDSLEAANKAAELAAREELKEVTQDYSNSLHDQRQAYSDRAEQGRHEVDNSVTRIEDATSNRSWTGAYRSSEELGGSVFGANTSQDEQTSFLENCKKRWEAFSSATNRYGQQAINFMGKEGKEWLKNLTYEQVKDELTSRIPKFAVEAYEQYKRIKENLNFIGDSGKSLIDKDFNNSIDRFSGEGNQEPDPYKYTTMKPVPMEDEGDFADKTLRNFSDRVEYENPEFGEAYKSYQRFIEKWNKFWNDN